ncbi:caspase family protein [Bacillus pumilus]|uniref:caspase family protein n=1 Tax=Bacillus pumilus TaxID=1408 RepID=UPI0030002DED
MKKVALLTGINYLESSYKLKSCHNDVKKFCEKLVNEFDFSTVDIQLLLEEVATRKNIIEGLERLVNDLDSGDIGVFYYSGHGTQTLDLPPIDEADMLDEAIVPIDALNDQSLLIRDDEIKEILSKLRNGVHFVLVFDSCNSGDITKRLDSHSDVNNMIEKMIPPIHSVDFVKEIASNLVKNSDIPKSHSLAHPNYILLAGCKENEYSYDGGGNSYFTNGLINEMKKGMTYQELYSKVKAVVLEKSNHKQEPQIYGDTLSQKIFE